MRERIKALVIPQRAIDLWVTFAIVAKEEKSYTERMDKKVENITVPIILGCVVAVVVVVGFIGWKSSSVRNNETILCEGRAMQAAFDDPAVKTLGEREQLIARAVLEDRYKTAYCN